MLVLTLAFRTFVEAAVTNEGETSSNITEMIKELTQPGISEVLKISNEGSLMSTTSVVGESSQSRDLPEALPSLTPQLGKIPDFDTLNLALSLTLL